MYTVYSKPNCPNCTTVKNVLTMNDLEYQEKVLGVDVSVEEFMEVAPGSREMPQVFLGDKRIGGLNDFKAHLIEVQ